MAVGLISDRSVNVGDDVSVDDVSPYFSDPDGDILTYTAASSDTGLATASVSGSTVTVTGAAEGSATVTVTVSSFLGACTVGMELDPGDACSVGFARFEVLADGWGSFGCCFTAGQGIHINQFSAAGYRVPTGGASIQCRKEEFP